MKEFLLHLLNKVKSQIDKSAESIIDVNEIDIDLTIDNFSELDETPNFDTPPYWRHRYIHSSKSIKDATKAQQKYYAYFQKQFNKGKIVDLQGNTNYAFVLYFELIDNYYLSKNIVKLEQEFELLGKICKETKRYIAGFLKIEFAKRKDAYSKKKLSDFEDDSYLFENGYINYNPNEFKLGELYKTKLQLSKNEVRILNKLNEPNNSFLEIEVLCRATVIHFLYIVEELNKRLANKNTSLKDEIKKIVESNININNQEGWNAYNLRYLKQLEESKMYQVIFKRVENSVRAAYLHKRKLSEKYISNKNIVTEFERKIGVLLSSIIEKHSDKIEKPTSDATILLNKINVNRWKIIFTSLKDTFEIAQKEQFIAAIKKLEIENEQNKNGKNIYLEASKFMAKFDKTQSLKYYAQYVYMDSLSEKVECKPLTKTAHKLLFKTDEQKHQFEQIITVLIKTKNIESALSSIANFYIPKRKKIKLDFEEIKKVAQKTEATTELLNKLLDDEPKTTSIKKIGKEETKSTTSAVSPNNSIFKTEIELSKLQEKLLLLFAEKSYQLSQLEVETYATKNGLFKNQLIDSINEACEDFLDDEALIEEEAENYIIEQSYYNEILK